MRETIRLVVASPLGAFMGALFMGQFLHSQTISGPANGVVGALLSFFCAWNLVKAERNLIQSIGEKHGWANVIGLGLFLSVPVFIVAFSASVLLNHLFGEWLGIPYRSLLKEGSRALIIVAMVCVLVGIQFACRLGERVEAGLLAILGMMVTGVVYISFLRPYGPQSVRELGFAVLAAIFTACIILNSRMLKIFLARRSD